MEKLPSRFREQDWDQFLEAVPSVCMFAEGPGNTAFADLRASQTHWQGLRKPSRNPPPPEGFLRKSCSWDRSIQNGRHLKSKSTPLLIPSLINACACILAYWSMRICASCVDCSVHMFKDIGLLEPKRDEPIRCVSLQKCEGHKFKHPLAWPTLCVTQAKCLTCPQSFWHNEMGLSGVKPYQNQRRGLASSWFLNQPDPQSPPPPSSFKQWANFSPPEKSLGQQQQHKMARFGRLSLLPMQAIYDVLIAWEHKVPQTVLWQYNPWSKTRAEAQSDFHSSELESGSMTGSKLGKAAALLVDAEGTVASMAIGVASKWRGHYQRFRQTTIPAAETAISSCADFCVICGGQVRQVESDKKTQPTLLLLLCAITLLGQSLHVAASEFLLWWILSLEGGCHLAHEASLLKTNTCALQFMANCSTW